MEVKISVNLEPDLVCDKVDEALVMFKDIRVLSTKRTGSVYDIITRHIDMRLREAALCDPVTTADGIELYQRYKRRMGEINDIDRAAIGVILRWLLESFYCTNLSGKDMRQLINRATLRQTANIQAIFACGRPRCSGYTPTQSLRETIIGLFGGITPVQYECVLAAVAITKLGGGISGELQQTVMSRSEAETAVKDVFSIMYGNAHGVLLQHLKRAPKNFDGMLTAVNQVLNEAALVLFAETPSGFMLVPPRGFVWNGTMYVPDVPDLATAGPK